MRSFPDMPRHRARKKFPPFLTIASFRSNWNVHIVQSIVKFRQLLHLPLPCWIRGGYISNMGQWDNCKHFECGNSQLENFVNGERVGILIYDNNTTDFPTTYYVGSFIHSPGIGNLDWIKVLCSRTQHFTLTVFLMPCFHERGLLRLLLTEVS